MSKVFVPSGKIVITYDFPVVLQNGNTQKPNRLPPARIDVDAEPEIDIAQIVQTLNMAAGIAIQRYIIEKEQGIVYGDKEKDAGAGAPKKSHN